MPESGEDPLVLDALAIGDLVHMTLDCALQTLEAAGGLAKADESQIASAVEDAATAVAGDWESERAVPPAVIWRRTLDDARILTTRALTYGDEHLPQARSYGEVPLAARRRKSDAASPWDRECRSRFPTRVPHRRLHRSARHLRRRQARACARLQDRTTAQGRYRARRRKRAAALPLCLRCQGAARRRCIDQRIAVLSCAIRSISSSRIPKRRSPRSRRYLQAARANLLAGGALLGPDTGGDYDDLAFALPANAGATYCKRKMPAATERFGDAAHVWEAR